MLIKILNSRLILFIHIKQCLRSWEFEKEINLYMSTLPPGSKTWPPSSPTCSLATRLPSSCCGWNFREILFLHGQALLREGLREIRTFSCKNLTTVIPSSSTPANFISDGDLGHFWDIPKFSDGSIYARYCPLQCCGARQDELIGTKFSSVASSGPISRTSWCEKCSRGGRATRRLFDTGRGRGSG